jgi:hypothetical protein
MRDSDLTLLNGSISSSPNLRSYKRSRCCCCAWGEKSSLGKPRSGVGHNAERVSHIGSKIGEFPTVPANKARAPSLHAHWPLR